MFQVKVVANAAEREHSPQPRGSIHPTPQSGRCAPMLCGAPALRWAHIALQRAPQRWAAPSSAWPAPKVRGLDPKMGAGAEPSCCPAGSQWSAGDGSREGRSCKRGGCCPTQGWGISALGCWRPFAGCLQTLPPAHPRSSVHKKCQKKFVHSSNYRIVWFCGFLW